MTAFEGAFLPFDQAQSLLARSEGSRSDARVDRGARAECGGGRAGWLTSMANGPGHGEAGESGIRLPHRFGPAGDQPVEIRSLSGRQGERTHVRAAPRRKPSSARDHRQATAASTGGLSSEYVPS